MSTLYVVKFVNVLHKISLPFRTHTGYNTFIKSLQQEIYLQPTY